MLAALGVLRVLAALDVLRVPAAPGVLRVPAAPGGLQVPAVLDALDALRELAVLEGLLVWDEPRVCFHAKSLVVPALAEIRFPDVRCLVLPIAARVSAGLDCISGRDSLR